MTKHITEANRGFTLFEMLVVLSVMAVVSTIGVTGFFRLTEYWNELALTTRVNKSATLAFASMAQDFENVLSGRVSGGGVRGQQADTEDNVRFWRLVFEDDRLTLPLEVFNPLINARERLSVRYAVDRSGPVPCLMRWIVASDGVAEEGRGVVVATGVAGMRVHYFDGNDWRGQWNSADMPAMVRVSLSLMDVDRPDRNLARVATFPIHVK